MGKRNKQNIETECIYRHKPETFQEANDLIDRYLHSSASRIKLEWHR